MSTTPTPKNGTGTTVATKPTGPSTTLFRTAPARGKNLLIINKGPGAVSIPREGQAWDLMEIYFMAGDIAKIKVDPTFTDAEHVIFETSRMMRKFAIIKAIFEKHAFWQDYDSVMMFDDDILPVGCSIADIFALFAQTDCRIAQPALTDDSFYGHMIHVRNENFVWRRTNCVELMCPIMNQAALREYLPIFDDTVSGFGIDDYWSFHEWLNGSGVAVLDRTPVSHTRAVGGGMAYQGLSQDEECHDFMHEYAIPRYPHSSFGGVLEESEAARRVQLGDVVTGYRPKFTADSRFLVYATDQIAINAHAKAMRCESNDPAVLKAHLAAVTNVAAVSLHMLTRDFHHVIRERKRIAANKKKKKTSPFWSWVPW